MNIRHCVLMLLLLLLCLHSAEGVTIRREEFGHDVPVEHIAIVAVALGAALVMLLLLGVSAVVGFKVKLAAVMFAFLWTSVAVVGVVSWVVTYDAMRVEIETGLISFMEARSGEIKAELVKDLEQGARISSLVARMHTTQLLDLDGMVFPEYFKMYYTLIKEWQDYTIDWSYFATKTGFSAGYKKVSANGTAYGDGWVTRVNAKSNENLTNEVLCFERDAWDNCTKKSCWGDEWAVCKSTCSRGPAVPCTHGNILSFTNGERPAFGQFLSQHFDQSTYHAIQRPWYAYTNDTVWSAPYLFSETIVSVGFTVSTTFFDASGAPYGVSCADYTLSNMQDFLLSKRPTTNGIVLIVNSAAQVLGTSEADGEQYKQVGDTDNYEPWLLGEKPGPLHDIVSTALYGAHGSLDAAMLGDSILHHKEHVVLVSAFTVTGNLRLAVVMGIPYADVLDTANEASTDSLLIVVIVSACAGLLVTVVVLVVLRPLSKLAQDMELVAWMKVDETKVRPVWSITSEVTGMSGSFNRMVANLKEFQQFLPQSIKIDLIESSSDDATLLCEFTAGSQNESRKSSTITSQSSNSNGRLSLSHSMRKSSRFAMELCKKMVTILAVNLRNSHDSVRDQMELPVTHVMTTYVETVVTLGREHKGVIDVFSGDRFTVSFNALTVLKSHHNRSGTLALALHSKLDVTQGIASGEAQCGNTGCASLKRFNVLGPVVNNAFLLERGARLWAVPSRMVGDEAISNACSFLFIAKALWQVRESPKGRAHMANALTRREGGGGEDEVEWMYEMERSHTTGYGKYNEVVHALYTDTLQQIESPEGRFAHLPKEERKEINQRYHKALANGPELPHLLSFQEERRGRNDNPLEKESIM